ncbi:MAG: DUF3795 domain-containing protein [Myxococcales bacterium]|nr:DUF3795 domain-containing protein [Myxococcales bacterium]
MSHGGRVEPALAGACGACCGACLAHRGELAREASRLLERIRRQGFLGLAKRLDSEGAPKVDAFFEVLERIARTPNCPGCGRGGGVLHCPVRACARENRMPTCAGCARLRPCASGRGGEDRASLERRRRSALREDGQRDFPFSAPAFLRRLTRKYGGWNLRNLERISEVGLARWLREMQREPHFRTVDVKSPKDVFR